MFLLFFFPAHEGPLAQTLADGFLLQVEFRIKKEKLSELSYILGHCSLGLSEKCVPHAMS